VNSLSTLIAMILYLVVGRVFRFAPA